MSGTPTYWSVLVLIRPSLMPRQHLESTSDRYMTMEVCGASLMACVAWTKMCAACVFIGSMCEWRLVRGLWYPYDRIYQILPIRDSKMNIIGATRWRSEGWARAGLEMLPPTHTVDRLSLRSAVGLRRESLRARALLVEPVILFTLMDTL